jgi:hypothetical protein
MIRIEVENGIAVVVEADHPQRGEECTIIFRDREHNYRTETVLHTRITDWSHDITWQVPHGP